MNSLQSEFLLSGLCELYDTEISLTNSICSEQIIVSVCDVI